MMKVLSGRYRRGFLKMKLLMVATLALSFLAAPLATAQNRNRQGPAFSKPGVTRENETGVGVRTNPTLHTYQKGERLSLAYGSFEAVPDWDAHHLAMPAEGYHWVYYGNTYLLTRIDTGVIIDIVMASWGAGRA
jgi:Ni/Co efflux regulator RcnB